MKTVRISPRTVELLVGILATTLIVTGIAWYAWNEPSRLEATRAKQLTTDLNGAMTLYAQNCAVCHGAAGEGIGATPALSNPALQEMDVETITKIISRGLYGSTMTAWSLEDGGSLSEYQIGQLVNLIHHGDWGATQARVVNLGLAPLIPFVSEADPLILDSLAILPQGNLLANGISLYAENCVACHGSDGLGTTLAPALNAPVVREQNAADLERTLRLGVPGTLMAGWGKSLDNEQVAALLELMLRWDEIPSGAIPAPDQPILVTAESLALGAELYTASCSNCHGPEGQGSQRAPSLNVRAYLADTPDSALEQIITLGVPETAMPAWGDRMSEAQIQAVVGFIRSWEPTAPEIAQPVRVRGPWWKGSTSPGDGQQLPSGGASASTNTQTTGELAPISGNSEMTKPAIPDNPVDQHQGNGAGQNSPWVAPELPWYQTLDQRAIMLILIVIGLAMLMVLAALHGLNRLKKTLL